MMPNEKLCLLHFNILFLATSISSLPTDSPTHAVINMLRLKQAAELLFFSFLFSNVAGLPGAQTLLRDPLLTHQPNVSQALFAELEELARVVDISYCVGSTGIQKPFLCASRCSDFAGFELITTWNTGPLLADSCGYIAVSHPPSPPRIVVAFRGTYSITNTIIDLSTVPQEYVPYPGDSDAEDTGDGPAGKAFQQTDPLATGRRERRCDNCTVHAGFMLAWKTTREQIMPHLQEAITKHPGYQLTLVGHSLGGAVAALAALDCHANGWNPIVTTFGEPKFGNLALMRYVDDIFLPARNGQRMYRRVTHVDDPVPLLPLKEWGYRMHAGEVYISKASLSPAVGDLRQCTGDEDLRCISGADPPSAAVLDVELADWLAEADMAELPTERNRHLLFPPRFKLWQLLFAHRDYFWRLGLCIPGGDPYDWYRKYPEAEIS